MGRPHIVEPPGRHERHHGNQSSRPPTWEISVKEGRYNAELHICSYFTLNTHTCDRRRVNSNMKGVAVFGSGFSSGADNTTPFHILGIERATWDNIRNQHDKTGTDITK